MNVILILFFSLVLPIWIVFHFVFTRKSARHHRRANRRRQQLEASKAQLDSMEKSLRSLEKYLTSSAYHLDREIKAL